MNIVIQNFNLYEPKLFISGIDWKYHTNIDTSNSMQRMELIGSYREYKELHGYNVHLGNKIVAIVPKVIQSEEKEFKFNSLYDVGIGGKIEVDNQVFKVLDKKYNLDGYVVYFIEDKYTKCVGYSELYSKIKSMGNNHLEKEWSKSLTFEEYEKGFNETRKKRTFLEFLGFK